MDAVNDTDRELLRRIWIEADRKPTAFVCIDTEFTSNGICELGIATRQKGTRTVSCHFIVNNNRGLRQKIPRPCTYGNSEEVPNHYALCPHLDNAFGLARRFNQVVVLVGHDVQNDIRNLKQFCHWDIPPEVIILDTLRIWRAWINIQERGNLEQALSFFNIETKPGELHNAGNDAHYTMELLFRQANQAFHFPERMSPTVPEVRVRQRPVRPIRLDKKLDKKSRVKRRCDLELSRRAPSPESPTHRSKRRRVFDDADLRGFDVVFQQGPIKANGLQKGPNTLNFLDDVFVDQGPSQKTIFNNGNGFAQGAGTQQPPKYPASAREARAWAREVRAQEHDFGYPFSSPKAQPDFIDLTNDTPPWKCAGELIDLTNDTPPRKNGADVIDLARDPPPPWPAGVFQFGQKDGLQSTPKGGQFDFQAMMDQEEIKNQEAMKDHEEMKNQEEMKPVVDQKARGLGSRIMSCLTRLSPFGKALRRDEATNHSSTGGASLVSAGQHMGFDGMQEKSATEQLQYFQDVLRPATHEATPLMPVSQALAFRARDSQGRYQHEAASDAFSGGSETYPARRDPAQHMVGIIDGQVDVQHSTYQQESGIGGVQDSGASQHARPSPVQDVVGGQVHPERPSPKQENNLLDHQTAGAAQQVLISETAATRDVPVPSPGP